MQMKNHSQHKAPGGKAQLPPRAPPPPSKHVTNVFNPLFPAMEQIPVVCCNIILNSFFIYLFISPFPPLKQQNAFSANVAAPLSNSTDKQHLSAQAITLGLLPLPV